MSDDWRERKAEEDRQRSLSFERLDALARRVDGYRRRAETSAQVVAGLPNGCPRAAEQEAADMRRLAEFVDWYAARLDRLHRLETPAPHPTSAYGGGKRRSAA